MTTLRKTLVPPPVPPLTREPKSASPGGEAGARSAPGEGSSPSPVSQPPTPNSNPVCTFCGSTNTELESLFGSQLIVSQFRCRDCHAYFEGVREGR